MMLKFKLPVLIAAVLGFVLVGSASAEAQVMSGRGIHEQFSRQVNCLAEIERLELIVQTLEAQREALINCNENGQVFDGNGCVDLADLEGDWNPDPTKPGTLRFIDILNNQSGSTITVVRGRDGADAVCPDGYEEVQ